MERKIPENYQVEDFVTDDSFINYHFQANDEDQAFWESWLNDNPGYSALAEAAQEMLQSLSLKLPEKEFQEELTRLKSAINFDQSVYKTKKPALVRFINYNAANHSVAKRIKRVAKFFVPLLFVFLAGGYILYQQFTKHDSRLSEKYNAGSAPVVFTLSDSTVVTLAPQSTLRYPEGFIDNERKVYLDGEAQFHVKRDVAHPFKVYSKELVATVLGTIFNVKQLSGDSVVQIELLKGKLKVETIDSSGASVQSVILNPEERIVYNRHAKNLQKETWQSNNEHSATTSHLQFRQDKFDAIALQLKSVFGVTVINLSDKKDWRFTGEFTNSTAKDIIENICIIKNLKYQVQGDTFFIK